MAATEARSSRRFEKESKAGPAKGLMASAVMAKHPAMNPMSEAVAPRSRT